MSKPKKILLAIAGALVALVVVAAVLLKSPPAAYRRTAAMGADPDAVARFDEEVVNQVGNVYLDKSRQTPLDLRLTEDAVNARIVQTLADLETAGKPMPPILRDVRVAFEPGEVIVATRVGSGASAVVVAQAVRLAVGPEGRLLVQPGTTSVGLMPVPVDVVGQARPLIAREVERLQQANDDTWTLWVMLALQQALDGEAIPLGKGKKRIVLDRIEIQRGVLVIEGHQAGRKDKSAAPAATPAAGAPAVIRVGMPVHMAAEILKANGAEEAAPEMEAPTENAKFMVMELPDGREVTLVYDAAQGNTITTLYLCENPEEVKSKRITHEVKEVSLPAPPR